MDPSIAETAPEGTTSPEPVAATSAEAPKPKKVTVKLRHIGDAPILKKSSQKMTVNPSETVAGFTLIMRKILKLEANGSLFFYIDSTFAPSPDTTFETLSRCYSVKSTDKEVLELQYSTTPAYG